MSRFWKEKLDPVRHRDHMSTSHICGSPVDACASNTVEHLIAEWRALEQDEVAPHDNIVERWVYFVEACSFTFQFQSLAQIEECLAFFSQKIHPSSMQPSVTLEYYWQSWEQRLPLWLFEEPKRQRVVRALQRALAKFKS